MNKLRNLTALLVIAACLSGGLLAQENFELGKMWTFEHVPHDYFMEEHGFELTQDWLDAVRLSSLRYGGGCSASFVSPKGLIMTNHHCARGDIEKASPPGEDWMKNGYVAETMDDEVKLEGLVVKQMVASTDVTARMNEGIMAGDDDETVVSKRSANEQKILAEARENNPAHECSITALYHGGLYMLYEYRVFDDLRLVAAPHLQTAHFGGDPDNFTYPRFGIDFTFVRAYVDGEPYDSSAHYFKFKPEGAIEGESVFIPGNPGSTERLMTHAQLEYDRDTYLPIIREHINILIAYLDARVAANPETEQSLKPQMLRFENGRKAYGGYHASLLDESLMAQKVEAEKAFREKIAANDELQAKYGDAWDQIDAITDELAIAMRAGRVYRNLDIPLIGRALQVVLATSPDTPDDMRERIKGQIKGGDLRRTAWQRAL
jgi:hypothetical protein